MLFWPSLARLGVEEQGTGLGFGFGSAKVLIDQALRVGEPLIRAKHEGVS